MTSVSDVPWKMEPLISNLRRSLGALTIASESCALDAAGASLLRDVEPGEIVVADTRTGELRSIKDHCGRKDTQMCVFEYIYFSRPDSIIEGSSVHEARKQAGRFLAQAMESSTSTTR